MINVTEVSIQDYFNKNEEDKQKFYDLILINNNKVSSNTHYKTVISPAPQAKIPEKFFHQLQGKLKYIAPLRKKHKQNGGLSFLTLCDCGQWHILDAIDFRKEKQTMCPTCKYNNMTTMKDISGQIFGQLQAIRPSSKRGSDGSVYWICQCIDCGHQQEVIKYNLTKTGHLCAVCGEKSKGEYKVAQILQENNLYFIREKTFEDCLFPDSFAHAKFDFFVDNKYIIEIDGQHHFFPLKYGKNISDQDAKLLYNKVLNHDRYKNQYCFLHQIPIIRIPYLAIETLKIEDLIVETSKFLLYNISIKNN